MENQYRESRFSTVDRVQAGTAYRVTIWLRLCAVYEEDIAEEVLLFDIDWFTVQPGEEGFEELHQRFEEERSAQEAYFHRYDSLEVPF